MSYELESVMPPHPPASSVPRAVSGNVIRLGTGSRRVFERLDHGLEVWHKARRLDLANWSLGGLGLIVSDCAWDGSEVISLTLRVPLPDGYFPIPVEARLVHYTPGTGYAGLRFQGLPAASYGALRHIQQRYKADEPLTLTALHDSCRSADSGELLLLHPNTTSTLRNRARVTGHVLRYGAVAAVLVLALYLMGYALTVNIFTLTAPYAAVTTPALHLTGGWRCWPILRREP
jgi:hypothetical protein